MFTELTQSFVFLELSVIKLGDQRIVLQLFGHYGL